ncbi:MAG: tRNA (adenosine(37)-N6)-threonylcarbamoyltransferase complex ATPase subunit type 1 TsaE [Chitinophagaceae bacterium]
MTTHTYTLNDISSVAAKLLQVYSAYSVWAFYAPMGAGKTTLTSAIMAQLGESKEVSSPTFSIVQQYQTANKRVVYHMDWYRLKNEEEAIDAGIEDMLYSGNFCMVEWPERAEELLPPDTLKIAIEIIDEQTRKLNVIVTN